MRDRIDKFRWIAVRLTQLQYGPKKVEELSLTGKRLDEAIARRGAFDRDQLGRLAKQILATLAGIREMDLRRAIRNSIKASCFSGKPRCSTKHRRTKAAGSTRSSLVVTTTRGKGSMIRTGSIRPCGVNWPAPSASRRPLGTSVSALSISSIKTTRPFLGSSSLT